MFKFSLLFIFFFHMLQLDFCLSFEWRNNHNIPCLHKTKTRFEDQSLQKYWNRSKSGVFLSDSESGRRTELSCRIQVTTSSSANPDFFCFSVFPKSSYPGMQKTESLKSK